MNLDKNLSNAASMLKVEFLFTIVTYRPKDVIPTHLSSTNETDPKG